MLSVATQMPVQRCSASCEMKIGREGIVGRPGLQRLENLQLVFVNVDLDEISMI